MSDNDIAEQDVESSPALADGFGPMDFVIAGGLAIGVFLLYMLLAYPGIYPGVWDCATVAARIRPAGDIFPGLWRPFAGLVFKVAGVSGGLAVLKLLGWAGAGAIAGLVYLVFRQAAALSLRSRLRYSRRRLWVGRFAPATAAAVFAASEPMWRAGQFFSPVTLQMGLTAFAVVLFLAFLRNGGVRMIYLAALLGGVMVAESPFGTLAVAICWALYAAAMRHPDSIRNPFASISVEQISRWHITFLLIFGVVATAALNCWSFAAFDGLVASGATGVGSLPQMYLTHYWSAFTSAASPTGWLFLLVIFVLPGVLAGTMMPKACDEEHFLPYGIGMVFLLSAVMALSQFCAVPSLWVISWHSVCTVSSEELSLCVYLVSAFGLMAAMLVMGVDVFCRDHEFIANQHFNASDEDEEEGDAAVASGGERSAVELARERRARAVLVVALWALVPAVTIPSRVSAKAHVMMAVVQAYAETVLDECRGREWLFTDGRYDCLLELLAKGRGQRLNVMSFIVMGADARESYIRMRGVADGEDRLAVAMGTDALVRSWLRYQPGRLRASACQLGFEIWKRMAHPLPPMMSLLARPGETDAETLAAGAANQRRLADMVRSYYSRHRSAACNDAEIEGLFEVVQWRLARMARYRAELKDVAGDVAGAKEETKLADELDRTNRSFRRILELMERRRQNSRGALSPREGLRNALQDANYALAAQYADAVLKADPQNPDANFAMGMLSIQQQQFSRAEQHFMRCMVRSPNDPAVFNNLAMVQMMLGKYESAMKQALIAQKLAPGSADVADTIRQIEAGAKAAKEGRPPPAAAKGEGRRAVEFNPDEH